jgi:uncharacterized protein YecE (DUF72 family)
MNHIIVGTASWTDKGLIASKRKIDSVWEVTVPSLAIIRLHGRNHETWNVKSENSADRFNYDYTDAELEEFARKVSDLPAAVSQVIFNNNFEDQGQHNATQSRCARSWNGERERAPRNSAHRAHSEPFW